MRTTLAGAGDLMGNCGLSLVITYVDAEALLGADFMAASSRYSGAAALWVYPDDLRAIASVIEGFPAAVPDTRTASLGSAETGYAGGYVSLLFRTVDGTGHAVVDVEIRDDDQLSPASGAFSVPVSASGIDEFVRGLRSVADRLAEIACLPATPG